MGAPNADGTPIHSAPSTDPPTWDDPEKLQTVIRNVTAAVRRAFGADRFAHADAEDFAVSAYRTFLRRLRAGQDFALQDYGDLTNLLVQFAWNRALKATKRKPAVQLQHTPEPSLHWEPYEELALKELDEILVHLQQICEESDRQVAAMKLEGETEASIAEATGLSVRTVSRRWKQFNDRLRHLLELDDE